MLLLSREIKAVDTDFFVLGGENGDCADAGDENVSLHEAFPDTVQKEDCAGGGGGRPGNPGKISGKPE